MPSRETVYSHELRILACEGCGAPLSAAVAGGLATCSYCGASSELRARDEREDRRRATDSSAASSESERMARLRDQASRDEPLPDSIAALLVNGRVERERAKEMLGRWRQTRATLRERGDFLTAERLFHLTRLLLPHLDHQARRALLETAVEILPDHRHRHVLRCELAIGAARVGEIEAAQAWLEAVEPRPVDLLMDSSVRTARATIAILRDRGGDLLAELGEHAGDVPVGQWYRGAHELLRVHGLEMMSRYDEALGRLDELARDLSEAGMRRAIEEHRPLKLLARTRLSRTREDLRARRALLRLRHAAAERTPARAVFVSLWSSALALALIALAGVGRHYGWFTMRAVETAFFRLWYGDLTGAVEHGRLPCFCTLTILLVLALLLWQFPRTLRSRRRKRDAEVGLAKVEAELAQLDRRIAAMSRRPAAK